MSTASTIVSIAESYIGQTETAGNSGFTSPAMHKKMKAVGWQKGQAWCSYLAELIWKEAYAKDAKVVALLDKLFSASATATYRQFDVNKLFTTGQVPRLGSIVIWQHGRGWQGHAGIVTELVNENSFKSVEGNTNDKGGREGYIVAKRIRTVHLPFMEKGLNLVGFVYPNEL